MSGISHDSCTMFGKAASPGWSSATSRPHTRRGPSGTPRVSRLLARFPRGRQHASKQCEPHAATYCTPFRMHARPTDPDPGERSTTIFASTFSMMSSPEFHRFLLLPESRHAVLCPPHVRGRRQSTPVVRESLLLVLDGDGRQISPTHPRNIRPRGVVRARRPICRWRILAALDLDLGAWHGEADPRRLPIL